MIAALSLLAMVLSRLVPFSELAFPAIAGVLLISVMIEYGAGTTAVVFLAVGLLSLLFALSNGAAIYYLVFFGPYPILKNFVEHLKKRPLQWAVKLILFNICAVIVYFALSGLTGLPDTVVRYGIPVTLLLVNAVFILYDIALSRLVVLYCSRIRNKIKKP